MKKVSRSPNRGSTRTPHKARHPRVDPSCFSKLTGILDPQILLVGDSWSWFLGGSPFAEALRGLGWDRWTVRSIATRSCGLRLVAVPGSRACDWHPGSLWMKNLEYALTHQPSLRIVHLSLGGNDFIRSWKGKRSEKKLEKEIFSHIANVIELIARIRPDIFISYHSYDWPDLSPPTDSEPSFSLTHGMQQAYVRFFHWMAGNPKPHVLNAALHRFCDAQHRFIEEMFPFVEFWEHIGFGHWIIADREEIDIEACQSIPGPRAALQADGFHYNSWANTVLARELLSESYLKHLRLPAKVRRAKRHSAFQVVTT